MQNAGIFNFVAYKIIPMSIEYIQRLQKRSGLDNESL